MTDIMRLSQCEVCEVPIEQPALGRPRRMCSKSCRTRAYEERRKVELRAQDPARIFAGSVTSCSWCSTGYVARRHDQKFCSALCRRLAYEDRAKRSGLDRSGLYYADCPDCGKLIAVRHPSVAGVKPCSDCRRIRNARINSRKNQQRRAAGELSISVHDLAVRDGARCNLCQRKIDMTLPGSHKMGPTIDHLLPVSMGGTNDSNNLALAHRRCNTLRKNRGAAQMLLEVTDAGSAAETG